MRRRNLTTKFLCILRRNNLLCRKTQINYASRLKVSHTVVPYEGYEPNWEKTAQHLHFAVRDQYKQ